jgi:segregation and condensation protein A
MSVNDSNNFEINLSNYSGPLDVLLDLAKSQKVNLAEISIAELADQFNTFINEAKKLNLRFSFRIFINGYLANLPKI